MDTWVDKTLENYQKIKLAFFDFGMPVFDMTQERFLNDSNLDVFTYGKPPSSIDIMVEVKGMAFNDCYENAVFFEEDGLQIRTIHFNNLINTKKHPAAQKIWTILKIYHTLIDQQLITPAMHIDDLNIGVIL